jgi:hypothetical protein
LQEYRIAFQFTSVEPSNDIPFGGPQQLLQRATIRHAQGRADIRFGGSCVHCGQPCQRLFECRQAWHLEQRANSLDHFVTGTIERFQAAISERVSVEPS